MTVKAYAKVNLTLEIFGRRPDGYHALRSVVVPVSLADTIEIEATSDGCVTSDTGYPDDLCLKAAHALRSTLNPQPSTLNTQLGARIHVTKRIPAGGGLGGGSADAAAVLRALNETWGLHLPLPELAEIGAQVGSDVPALVLGGPVVMEGRGEKVSPIPFPFSPLDLVLSHPGVACSTREIYAACTPRSRDDATATDRMIAALEKGCLSEIAAAAANDLEAPAARVHPEIADALVSLRTAGASGVTMSGSGSCVFGFAPDAENAARIAADLNARGLRSWAVRTLV